MNKNHRYHYAATFGWNPFAREDRRYMETMPYNPQPQSLPPDIVTDQYNPIPNQGNPAISSNQMYNGYPPNTVIVREQERRGNAEGAVAGGGAAAGLGITALIQGTRKGQQMKMGALGGATVGAGLGVANKYSRIKQEFEDSLNIARAIPNKEEREAEIARLKQRYSERMNVSSLALGGLQGGVVGGVAGGGLGLIL